MIGLRFGKTEFDPTPHDILSKSFCTWVLNNRPVNVTELVERFRKKSLGREAADYLKVVNVIFAYFVIFGYDVAKTNIAYWMWVMVKDSKGFDSVTYTKCFFITWHYQEKANINPKATLPFLRFATAFLVSWIVLFYFCQH